MATNVINIRRFVDVTTSVQETPTDVRRDWGALLFVQKGTDGQTTVLKKYNDLDSVVTGEGSNTEAAKYATVFFGTAYSGVSVKSPIYVATIGAEDETEFTTNFSALLGSEEYFYIGLDTTFSDSIKKVAAALTAASQSKTAHKLVLDDTSANVFDKTLTEDIALGDSCSVGAYVASNKYNCVAVCAVNPSNTNKYYSAALAAFYGSRTFTNSKTQMCSICFKVASGISAVDGADTLLDATSDFDTKVGNLYEKNVNVYANVKIVGLTAWSKGFVGSGDEISDMVSADYLSYRVTMAVFSLLQTTPRLAMNADGASKLASVLNDCFQDLASAGVIGGGVSIDGEVFPASGYKYSIPMPTGVQKANGLWDGIVCKALLMGSTKKVVILNDLVK